jgi:hypothetical protein
MTSRDKILLRLSDLLHPGPLHIRSAILLAPSETTCHSLQFLFYLRLLKVEARAEERMNEFLAP